MAKRYGTVSVQNLGKRTARADGEETKQLIRAVAKPMFEVRGYEQVSIKEICEAARVNPAAVNYHFGNKAGLYKELFPKPQPTYAELYKDLQVLRLAWDLFFQGELKVYGNTEEEGDELKPDRLYMIAVGTEVLPAASGRLPPGVCCQYRTKLVKPGELRGAMETMLETHPAIKGGLYSGN